MEITNQEKVRQRCGRPHVIGWVVVDASAVVDGGEKGRSICPVGWFMNVSHKPFMMAVSIHPNRYTHDLICQAQEFVLAFPGEDMAHITLDVGTRSGSDYNKFEAHNLTTAQGKFCRSPLIEECIVNLECKLTDQVSAGDHTVFIGEVMQIWQSSDDRRPLLSVDDSSAYEQLVQGKGYQFGVAKR